MSAIDASIQKDSTIQLIFYLKQDLHLSEHKMPVIIMTCCNNLWLDTSYQLIKHCECTCKNTLVEIKLLRDIIPIHKLEEDQVKLFG